MAKTYVLVVPVKKKSEDFKAAAADTGYKDPSDLIDALGEYIGSKDLETAYYPGPEDEWCGDKHLAPTSDINLVIWDGRVEGDAWYLAKHVHAYVHKKTGKTYVHESVAFPDL